MKKEFTIFLSGLLLFVLFSSAYAQNLKFGGRGGANLGFFSGNADPFEKKMRMAIGFGGIIEFWLNDMLAIQANALYNMKGAKLEWNYEETFFGTTYTYSTKETFKFSYLSLPIFGKLAIGSEGSPRIFLIGGPEVGILLSAKADVKSQVEGSGLNQEQSGEVDVKDESKSIEIVLNFGGGFEIPMDQVTIFIEGRYGLGVTKAFEFQDTSAESLRNQVIIINLGILFGL